MCCTVLVHTEYKGQVHYTPLLGIESIMFPKQQRRPLPSLLYTSFFCAIGLKVALLYITTLDNIPLRIGRIRIVVCPGLGIRSFAQFAQIK